MRIILVCLLISAASAAVIQHGGLRQRRDVAEIVSEQKYLPPEKEYIPSEKLAETKAVDEVAVTEAIVEAEAPQETAVLAKNGYEYKTVRRLKYRQRRDVSEINPQYLPPVEHSANDSVAVEAPKESAVLAGDGYHYRTIKRLRF